MGKSFELLGMMAFQIFLAMIIGISLITSASKEEKVTTLTTTVVENFIYEISDIITGKKENMDAYSITEYLMEHLSGQGEHKTLLIYSAGGFSDREEEMNMDKLGYISNVLQGLKAIEEHELSLSIEAISIADSGKVATVTVNSYEKGLMSLPHIKDGTKKIPMSGTSLCTKKLVLKENGTIQLQDTDCTTDINFIE